MSRGIFGGGSSGTNEEIDYIDITSAGNATDFGDLSTPNDYLASCSNGTNERGIFAGGKDDYDTIQYVTINSTGNSSGFGNLTDYGRSHLGGCSNNTNERGVFGGGQYVAVATDIIDYITINSTGNATDFGDLTHAIFYAPAMANGVNERGVFSDTVVAMQYITINTLGNAKQYSNLLTIPSQYGFCTSDYKSIGMMAIGNSYTDEVDYFQISTFGQVADYGNLSVGRRNGTGTTNGTPGPPRCVFAGGSTAGGSSDVIDYCNPESQQNCSDFGNLTVARANLAATSNGGSRAIVLETWQSGIDIDNFQYIMSNDRLDSTAAVMIELLAGGAYLPNFIPVPPGGDRGIWMGGSTSASVWSESIEYITISTTGNGTDFGDLTVGVQQAGACSNGITGRGINMGGVISGSYTNVIGYITILSTGNATDFGDLNWAIRSNAGTDNGSNDRGLSGGGYDTANRNYIQYITISSTGNASDFGNLTAARRLPAGSSNATNERGLFSGGREGSVVNTIDYITINSTGNASDFGDLTSSRTATGACSNRTNERGLNAGGVSNIIDYVTINSAGNATDFGDLLASIAGMPGTSNGTNERGVFGGGTSNTDVIQYVTINSAGNATYFGDLNEGRYVSAATSNA